jgi:hypothetical protein
MGFHEAQLHSPSVRRASAHQGPMHEVELPKWSSRRLLAAAPLWVFVPGLNWKTGFSFPQALPAAPLQFDGHPLEPLPQTFATQGT